MLTKAEKRQHFLDETSFNKAAKQHGDSFVTHELIIKMLARMSNISTDRITAIYIVPCCVSIFSILSIFFWELKKFNFSTENIRMRDKSVTSCDFGRGIFNFWKNRFPFQNVNLVICMYKS